MLSDLDEPGMASNRAQHAQRPTCPAVSHAFAQRTLQLHPHFPCSPHTRLAYAQPLLARSSTQATHKRAPRVTEARPRRAASLFSHGKLGYPSGLPQTVRDDPNLVRTRVVQRVPNPCHSLSPLPVVGCHNPNYHRIATNSSVA